MRGSRLVQLGFPALAFGQVQGKNRFLVPEEVDDVGF